MCRDILEPSWLNGKDAVNRGSFSLLCPHRVGLNNSLFILIINLQNCIIAKDQGIDRHGLELSRGKQFHFFI